MHFWGHFRGCRSFQNVKPCSKELFGISKASFLLKEACKKFWFFKSYARKNKKKYAFWKKFFKKNSRNAWFFWEPRQIFLPDCQLQLCGRQFTVISKTEWAVCPKQMKPFFGGHTQFQKLWGPKKEKVLLTFTNAARSLLSSGSTIDSA